MKNNITFVFGKGDVFVLDDVFPELCRVAPMCATVAAVTVAAMTVAAVGRAPLGAMTLN